MSSCGENTVQCARKSLGQTCLVINNVILAILIVNIFSDLMWTLNFQMRSHDCTLRVEMITEYSLSLYSFVFIKNEGVQLGFFVAW